MMPISSFATLPKREWDRPFSNLSESIGLDAGFPILRFAEPTDRLSSDFERFRAFCNLFPQMKGHPLTEEIPALLREVFGIDAIPSPETCDAIWKQTADRLTAQPVTVADLLPKHPFGWLYGGREVPASLPPLAVPILDAENLMPAGEEFSALIEWTNAVTDAIDATAGRGGQVLFSLPNDFEFRLPDPYHIERLLQKPSGVRNADPLMRSQLFRMICRSMERHRELPLTFCAGNCGDDAVRLLAYGDEQIGLPENLTVCAGNIPTMERLFSFCKKQGGMRFGLDDADLRSEAELGAAWQALAARAPIGRISPILIRDARLLRVSEARTERILSKI